MKEQPAKISMGGSAGERIDLNKLRIVLRKNLVWVIFILICCNLASYLFIRYTKDLFESSSELKLDIKQDATELGIKNFVEDQNLSIVSGEIEQIRSRLFFNQVIDSMNLWVNYYYIGNVLNNELYGISPFTVKFQATNQAYFDQPFYLNFTDDDNFTIQFGEKGVRLPVKSGGTVKFPGITIWITRNENFTQSDKATDYSFVINSRKKLLDYLSSNITVAPLNFNANTIRISFQDFNAHKAFDINNHIDSLYIKYSYQQKNLANKQKIEWLNKELAQVEEKMGDFENYFENFTLQNKSSNLSEDLRKTIYRINRIDSMRFDLNKRLTSLNTLIDAINDTKEISYARQPFLPDFLNKKLEDLERMREEQDKLGLSYNENTFAFQQKEQQLAKVRSSVFAQLTSLKSTWMKSAGELSVQKDRLEKDFASMPDKNTQYSKKQRFYKLYEEFYLTMMQSKSEFEISQAGSTQDFKVLSTASLPTIPISPKRSLILGIGFVASIVLSLLFIGILYVANDKITNVLEIETAISTPVLGTIPLSHHHQITAFHVIDNPKSNVSESIRSLRTNLDFFTTGGIKKVISVSSTISGEGKSFLAMNLGAVIAMSHKKVVLVDLDMRKQKTNLPLEIVDKTRGVSTVLIKKHTWQECVIKTALPTFDYIPSGPHPPNPSELLLNGEFSSLLEELKKEYEVILIDTPPVGLVTDGIMAMKRSDLSIYVFRANYSKKDFIHNLQRIININKLDHVATVLNALPSSSDGYGYGYYEDQTLPKRKIKNLFTA